MSFEPLCCLALGDDGEHADGPTRDIVEDADLLDSKAVLGFADATQLLNATPADLFRLVSQVLLESPLDSRPPTSFQSPIVRLGILGDPDLVSHMARIWPGLRDVKGERGLLREGAGPRWVRDILPDECHDGGR
jgi:hypothetical protein